MRDIKILVISDDPILNSALANSIEGQVFQWKPGVVVFDPHGDPKSQLMKTDDMAIKQMAGECNVEITTMCIHHRNIDNQIDQLQQLIGLAEIRLQQVQYLEEQQPKEPKTDGDHHH